MLNYVGRSVGVATHTGLSIKAKREVERRLACSLVTHLQVFQPRYFVNLFHFHFHVTDDITGLNNTGSSALINLGDERCE
jgi:predicted metalloprotease with PDZ domain